MSSHFLNHLFSPTSIAVIGASDRKNAVGYIVLQNLIKAQFKGAVYPVNLKHDQVQGQKAYAHITDISDRVELAVVATPAASVPEIIRECGEAGVKAVIVMSAGFSEGDDHQGKKLQQQLLEYAQQYGIRILGPNCLGIMIPSLGLNATFSRNIATDGHMSLVSQSGALCTAMLDWAETQDIGFSSMISLGDAADVDFGDILSYLALDPHTNSILLYIEGIRNARSFISGLRVAARLKPVVVIKAGRHDDGIKAAVSHTGALVGSDDVFHAALRRAGAVRVYSIKDLFSAAKILASNRSHVSGNRLAIVTNAGGPGVLASDRAADQNVELANLSNDTINRLNEFLPLHWSHGNPVDILGDADAERYGKTLEIVQADENVDGILTMLTPQAMTTPGETANAIIQSTKEFSKPLLTCWMGGKQVLESEQLFNQFRIPHFETPEASVDAFSYLASYKRNQELLMQVPGPLAKNSEADVEGARLIIDKVLADDRQLLNDLEATAIMKAFNIPTVITMEASNADDALVKAEGIGFPVVMKINSPDIVHKSDVSGVRQGINSATSVRSTFNELIETVKQKNPNARINGVTIQKMYRHVNSRELSIGIVKDPVFGPVISIGAGGTMIEIMKDKSVSLPPVNRFIAQQMIARTNVNKMLGNFRNMPEVNRHALENVLLSVSELVCEVPQIIEMDINPLFIDDENVTAVDVRIKVDFYSPTSRRYSHMAIHPYPRELVTTLQLPEGINLTIRPIRPEDAKIEDEFVRELSPQSKYFRFMQALHELTPEMLVRFTQIDYDLEMALILVVNEQGKEKEVGVARYIINPDGKSCEFAIVVADKWHHKGLGFHLMAHLMEIARSRDISVMQGEVLADNQEMLSLARTLGFKFEHNPDDAHIMNVSRRL